MLVCLGVEGEKWALLVSGTCGFIDYRHEADICHAYQLLKTNGYEDTNIVVFMGDVVANHGNNPRTGIVINNDKSIDYYEGIPKDYFGKNATSHNLVAVLLGHKSKIRGGSGKVIKSGLNDHIFFFYSGHGSELRLQMPSPCLSGSIFKEDLTNTLKKKHANGGYKNMVLYINSCLVGDIGTYIGADLRIYILTCGAPREDCLATYCNKEKGLKPPYPPEEYRVCVASEFGAAWMEHLEMIDTNKVTFQEQFESVKKNVLHSNVTQHGDLSLAKQKLSAFFGSSKPVSESTLFFHSQFVPNLLPKRISHCRGLLHTMGNEFHIDAIKCTND
ncbi:hypothetical protein vseg_003771 [Gypsophila vaccaria]